MSNKGSHQSHLSVSTSTNKNIIQLFWDFKSLLFCFHAACKPFFHFYFSLVLFEKQLSSASKYCCLLRCDFYHFIHYRVLLSWRWPFFDLGEFFVQVGSGDLGLDCCFCLLQLRLWKDRVQWSGSSWVLQDRALMACLHPGHPVPPGYCTSGALLSASPTQGLHHCSHDFWSYLYHFIPLQVLPKRPFPCPSNLCLLSVDLSGSFP